MDTAQENQTLLSHQSTEKPQQQDAIVDPLRSGGKTGGGSTSSSSAGPPRGGPGAPGGPARPGNPLGQGLRNAMAPPPPAQQTPAEKQAKADLAQQASQSKTLEKAKTTITSVKSMPEFSKAAGATLDALFPAEGDKRKVQIAGNFPLNSNVTIGPNFVIEGERSGGKLKVRSQLGFRLMAKADLWVAEAFVRAGLFGYFEVVGNNGAEIFDLLSLMMYNKVKATSAKAADYVWGKKFATDVKANMDDEDYVEGGVGGEVAAGFSADEGKKAAEVGVQHTAGKRVTKDKEEDTAVTTYGAKITKDPWVGEFKYVNSSVGAKKKGEINVSLARETDLLEFASVLSSGAINAQLVDWVLGSVGTIQGIVTNNAGLNVDAGGGRKVGAILRSAQSLSFGAQLGGAAAAAKLKDKFGDVQAKIGQKLEVKLEWEGGKAQLGVELSKSSAVSYGGDENKKFFALVENLTRIIAVPPIKF